MADLSTDSEFVFDQQFGQELCEVFADATGYGCILVDEAGIIVAASVRERIGTVHEAARHIMAGEVSEYAVTKEEAAASGGLMREGLSVAIDFDGKRVISFGIAGPLDAVTPIARLGGFCVRAVLHARELERTIVARYALEALNASEKMLEDMRIRANTDALTGVRNRPYIEDAARNEMLRLSRYGHPVSMIFADLDHFKAINDRFGHVIGDRVLRRFCEVVQHATRSLDVFGRWGGEEFLIIAPNSGQDIAHMLAKRIRAALHRSDFSPVEHVTASFGVAECLPYDTFESWLLRADTALYQAKKDGRDRVVVAPLDVTEMTEQRPSVGFVRLVWHGRYACGHPAIDEQHKELFETCNSLLEALVNNRPKDEIGALIDVLLSAVRTHFATEEQAIEAAGFDGAVEHKALHQAILERAGQLASQFASDHLAMGELFSFLAYDVIAKHILCEDRRFFGTFA